MSSKGRQMVNDGKNDGNTNDGDKSGAEEARRKRKEAGEGWM